MEKYRPEKFRIPALFTQWLLVLYVLFKKQLCIDIALYTFSYIHFYMRVFASVYMNEKCYCQKSQNIYLYFIISRYLSLFIYSSILHRRSYRNCIEIFAEKNMFSTIIHNTHITWPTQNNW